MGTAVARWLAPATTPPPPPTLGQAEEGHATAREWSVEQCRKAKVKSHLEFGRMVAVFGFVVLSSWFCLPKGANRSNNGRFTFSLLLAFATFLSGKALMLLGMNMLRLPENLVSGGERAFSFLIVICTVLPVMTLASLLALLPSMLYLCLSLALITAVVLPVVAAYWYMRRRREGGDEAAAYEEHKEEHDVASKIA